MAKITFSKQHHSEQLRFWTWRDQHRKAEDARVQDREQAEMFRQRAQELRDEAEFLLSGGLSEGAEHSLNALAEEDMADFCILVDLAEPVEIAGVTPLTDSIRQHLHQFLDNEPWHSLVVDNDITVALAMLDSVGTTSSNRPWYDYAPHLLQVVARVLDNASAEQIQRFVAEYNVLAERDHLHLPQDLPNLFETLLNSACQRVGIAPPPITK